MSWLYSILFTSLFIPSQTVVVDRYSRTLAVDPPPSVSYSTDVTETFEQTYPLSANGRVKVSNINGSISVEGWDRNEIRLVAEKVADSTETLAEVELKIESRADSFSVETKYDRELQIRRDKNDPRRKLRVDFRIMVPRGAVLDEIDSVNGSIDVKSMSNVTKASAVNGTITGTNLRGEVKLSTVNGVVTADIDGLDSPGKISLNTVNGRVNLVIPSDANVTLKADSLNGKISNDLGLPVRKGKYVGRDLYGRVGSGETQIRLGSVNGEISVSKKNDGKTSAPVVDLLPERKEGDDWETSSIVTDTVQVNKVVAKAIEDTAVISDMGAEIAQAELARLVPEIENIRLEGLRDLEKLEALRSLDQLKRLNDEEIKKLTEEKLKESLEKHLEVLKKIKIPFRSGGPTSFVEKKTSNIPVKGFAKVFLDAAGCDVTVRAWDKAEIQYIFTNSSADAETSAAAIVENIKESNVTLKVGNNARAAQDLYFFGRNGEVRLDVYVPKKSDVRVAANGSIRVEGVSGNIDIDGVDERIDIRNANGKLKVSSADGEVRIIGFTGELDSKTGDGDTFLEGHFSRINGTSDDGDIYLTVLKDQDLNIVANVERLKLDNISSVKPIGEGKWQFGKGGPQYTFDMSGGNIFVRNADLIFVG